jgi:hypothetical protein
MTLGCVFRRVCQDTATLPVRGTLRSLAMVEIAALAGVGNVRDPRRRSPDVCAAGVFPARSTEEIRRTGLEAVVMLATDYKITIHGKTAQGVVIITSWQN